MPDRAHTSATEVAAHWIDRAFGSQATTEEFADFPVSFRYDGQPAPALLSKWTMQRETAPAAGAVTLETIVLRDPSATLECRCVVKRFRDYPAVEWVVYFKNIGATDTAILADVCPLDMLLPVNAALPCQVHHARGALTQRDDFEPLATPLTFRQGGSRLDLAARTGKSSTRHLPFFNLQCGTGGVIGAIGWSGGWMATFERRREGIQIRAGLERTHLCLHPGEEVRTPRILLLFWQGAPDWDGNVDVTREQIHSQNVLRRLLLAHYTPRRDGQIIQPPFCEGVWGAQAEGSHLAKIKWLCENRIPTECYWIDAGWYGENPLAEAADGLGSGWMRQVGSWAPNAEAYPHGFAPIGAAVKAAGLGLLLWVEPERAFEGTRIVREHPEWLIGPVRSGNTDGVNFMVNLGLPEARSYLIELISGLIREGGVTCYRQDFNDLRVPELFALADAPDRIGMAESLHIAGLYAFWDELLARHPDLMIDNCAGGGQRIDLETMARSVPMWRSDLQCWPFDPSAMQTQSQGLAPWVPLSAAVCEEPTRYAMRSALGLGLVTHWCTQTLDGGVDLPVETVRQLMDEALAMRKYFYGDFYPLLTFSLADDVWAAWQYDRPDLGDGMMVAFRRHAAPFATWEAQLEALEAAAEYEVTAWDEQRTWRASGRQLMSEGFAVTIREKPGAALFTYRRVA
jgi:alpha-galactosidase